MPLGRQLGGALRKGLAAIGCRGETIGELSRASCCVTQTRRERVGPVGELDRAAAQQLGTCARLHNLARERGGASARQSGPAVELERTIHSGRDAGNQQVDTGNQATLNSLLHRRVAHNQLANASLQCAHASDGGTQARRNLPKTRYRLTTEAARNRCQPSRDLAESSRSSLGLGLQRGQPRTHLSKSTLAREITCATWRGKRRSDATNQCVDRTGQTGIQSAFHRVNASLGDGESGDGGSETGVHLVDSTLGRRKTLCWGCQLVKTARDEVEATADGLDPLKKPARVSRTQRMHRVIQREDDLLLARERGGNACLCITELVETPRDQPERSLDLAASADQVRSTRRAVESLTQRRGSCLQL